MSLPKLPFTLMGVLFILFVPFVVCDFIYAFNDNWCVEDRNTPAGFSLSIWLQVDAYSRIFCILFMPFAISTVINAKNKTHFVLSLTFTVVYMLFYIVWVVLGEVIYSDLDNRELCTNMEALNYLIANVILSGLILIVLGVGGGKGKN
jgi:hypothetical protein